MSANLSGLVGPGGHSVESGGVGSFNSVETQRDLRLPEKTLRMDKITINLQKETYVHSGGGSGSGAEVANELGN